MSGYPIVRLRRLRATEGLRRLVSPAHPTLQAMIWPVFVIEGRGQKEAIASLPGQFQMSIDVLCKELVPLAERGLGGVLLFGVPNAWLKTSDGAAAHAADGLVQRAVRQVKSVLPELPVFTDVCLCSYTTHGHCGPLSQGTVDNDAARALLGQTALSHAVAGADGVAPSAMMDGQVSGIRQALDAAGYTNTIIMSYAVKFASAFYGPFRDAAASTPQQGDRRTYQLAPGDTAGGLREAAQDESEGADILMVKPSLAYLDMLCRLREQTRLPLAAYNVSGEYAMLHHLAAAGGGDLYAMVRENLLALRRAGADILITYWANQYEAIYGE